MFIIYSINWLKMLFSKLGKRKMKGNVRMNDVEIKSSFCSCDLYRKADI
jgi:hypothetical protein